MSKKFLFTLIGVVLLAFIGVWWVTHGMLDVALWIAWFSALNALIGVYANFNVKQKKIIGENYIEALDDTKNNTGD